MDSRDLFLHASITEFHRYKTLADQALAQVSRQAWFYLPAEQSNTLAHIVKHVAGNLHSRWTDFLTSDGEKPDRHRDSEFELDTNDNIENLQARWEAGWQAVLNTLEALSADDLGRTIFIRGQPHTVVEAIQRSITHTAYHCGQIVQLAKQIRGADFESLSIPKGQSEAFSQALQETYKKKRG
jgi:uncharacterized damage-inducible protein DinB